MDDTIIKMTTDFEATKFDGEAGQLVAYITTYKNEDVVGDIMAPGVLDKFISEFPEGGKLPALWQHDANEVIGEWTKFESNARGVKGYGQIYTEVSRGNDVRNLIMRGMVGSVSIGFRAKDYEMRENEKGRIFKEIELVETSVVLRPANPRARITSAKTDDGRIDIRKLENILRDVELSQKERKVLLAEGVKGLMNLRDVVDSGEAKKSIVSNISKFL